MASPLAICWCLQPCDVWLSEARRKDEASHKPPSHVRAPASVGIDVGVGVREPASEQRIVLEGCDPGPPQAIGEYAG